MISGEIYPFNFCRDWTLGEKLSKRKYKKIHDKDIFVFHNSPYKLSDYWNVRKTRGLMSAYQPYYFFNRSISYLLLKFIAKSFLSFLKVVLIAPLILIYFKFLNFLMKKYIIFSISTFLFNSRVCF